MTEESQTISSPRQADAPDPQPVIVVPPVEPVDPEPEDDGSTRVPVPVVCDCGGGNFVDGRCLHCGKPGEAWTGL